MATNQQNSTPNAAWVAALAAQAQANESAEDSAALVIEGIATQLETAIDNADSLSAADEATLMGLAAQLKAHADPLSAAILANTPAAPAPAAPASDADTSSGSGSTGSSGS